MLIMIFFAGGNGRELVLPYIIERKRMDDLSSSIVDGRFAEQKVCNIEFLEIITYISL